MWVERNDQQFSRQNALYPLLPLIHIRSPQLPQLTKVPNAAAFHSAFLTSHPSTATPLLCASPPACHPGRPEPMRSPTHPFRQSTFFCSSSLIIPTMISSDTNPP